MREQNQKEIEVFCKNIHLLRCKAKISKREMAKRLQIGVYSIRKLEKGEIPPRMRCDVIFRVSKEFDVKPKELFMPLNL